MTKERLEEIENTISTFDSVKLYKMIKELTAEILHMEVIPSEFRDRMVNLLDHATNKLNQNFSGDEDGKANTTTDNRPC